MNPRRILFAAVGVALTVPVAAQELKRPEPYFPATRKLEVNHEPPPFVECYGTKESHAFIISIRPRGKRDLDWTQVAINRRDPGLSKLPSDQIMARNLNVDLPGFINNANKYCERLYEYNQKKKSPVNFSEHGVLHFAAELQRKEALSYVPKLKSVDGFEHKENNESRGLQCDTEGHVLSLMGTFQETGKYTRFHAYMKPGNPEPVVYYSGDINVPKGESDKRFRKAAASFLEQAQAGCPTRTKPTTVGFFKFETLS